MIRNQTAQAGGRLVPRAALGLALAGILTASPVRGADLSGRVQVAGGPAPYAVIWLDAPGAPPFVQTGRVVLDQRNLAFVPRVLAVRVGTVVDFPNGDRVFHNVFSFHDGKKFDLGMYPVGSSKPVLFDKPGLSRIFCNIHPNMAAYVLTVDTPYFSVTDNNGSFTIPSVPAGIYTYHAWRSGSSTVTGSVTIEDGRTLDIVWP